MRPKYLGTWNGTGVYEVDLQTYEIEAADGKGICFVIKDLDNVVVFNDNIIAKFNKERRYFDTTVKRERYTDKIRRDKEKEREREEVKFEEIKFIKEEKEVVKPVEKEIDVDGFIAGYMKIQVGDMIFKGDKYEIY